VEVAVLSAEECRRRFVEDVLDEQAVDPIGIRRMS